MVGRLFAHVSGILWTRVRRYHSRTKLEKMEPRNSFSMGKRGTINYVQGRALIIIYRQDWMGTIYQPKIFLESRYCFIYFIFIGGHLFIFDSMSVCMITVITLLPFTLLLHSCIYFPPPPPQHDLYTLTTYADIFNVNWVNIVYATHPECF